jgi:micrococcal nuclease
VRSRLPLAVALTLLFLLAPAALAKSCTKGKPCGNTCINVNYTCRSGTSGSTNTSSRSALPRSSTTSPPLPRSQPFSPQAQLRGPVDVVRFVDGDTVRIYVNGAEENVRLIGIDTPETVHPQRGVEPFGPEASAFLSQLLRGRPVWVELDVQERDHYRRPLVYLYYQDPSGDWDYQGIRLRQANLEIARNGFADVLTIPPNVRYAELYVEAVSQAREGKLGMWAGTEPSLSTGTTLAGLPYDPAGPDRDCSDFSTRAQAQAFFEAARPGDPHQLDSDDDGEACESLR